MRSFLLGAKTYVQDLPYDAEVEYLQGDGNSYISTGVSCVYADTVTVFVFNDFRNTSYRELCGCDNTFLIHSYYQSNPDRVLHRCVSQWDSGYVIMTNGFGQWSKVQMNEGGACCWINDGEYSAGNQSTKFTQSPSNTFNVFTAQKTSFFIGKIGPVSINRSETTVLDLIPVRKDGVGYMYDRVSGELFGNAGTGSFVIGPDKEVA